MKFVLCAVILIFTYVSADNRVPCASKIYCYGPLLHTVQTAGIFNDSKSFVDLKLKNPYDTVLANFDILMRNTANKPSPSDLKQFITENFEDGNELDNWKPTDFVARPKLLTKISDPVINAFAETLINLWPVLARKVKPEVVENPSSYSFIPVSNGFIIPGGRFKEYYYWDSYWIIRGLLISDMPETAKGMIENYFHLVRTLGHIPNGGRIYYTDRSQPPLLAKMALEYYKYSKNKEWLKQNIAWLEKELRFWQNDKALSVTQGAVSYTMYHYKAKSTNPRPESYVEDLKTVEITPDTFERVQLFRELKSAAESGWDFSTRWIFDQQGGNQANISSTEATRVVPVDLNAFLCEAFNIASYMYSELGRSRESNYWKKQARSLQTAIEHIMWNEAEGTWFDFDAIQDKQRKYFYPSNVAPLWSECVDKRRITTYGKRTSQYLAKVGILDIKGGVPASMIESGEQWDFPNAWPPLQAIVVQALEKSNNADALWVARKLATEWIHSNLEGYMSSEQMFEKYNALQPGHYGEGGEYTIQSGFGWTNGVALEFINTYMTDSYDDVEENDLADF